MLAMNKAVCDNNKDYRCRIKDRTIWLYLLRHEHDRPTEWSLEFVFADSVNTASNTLVDGRVVHLDSLQRVIYALPYT